MAVGLLALLLCPLLLQGNRKGFFVSRFQLGASSISRPLVNIWAFLPLEQKVTAVFCSLKYTFWAPIWKKRNCSNLHWHDGSYSCCWNCRRAASSAISHLSARLGPHFGAPLIAHWPSLLENTAHFGCVCTLELGNSTEAPPGAYQRRLCQGKTADCQRYSINTLIQWTGSGYTCFPVGGVWWLCWEEQTSNTSRCMNSCNSNMIHFWNQ